MAFGIKNSHLYQFNLRKHLYFGFFIRFVLILYGEHHDKTHALKYTDVDYHVFTDAAREISLGGSPFQRHSYRYTPFLAIMMLPNVHYTFLFGKVLFSAFDCLATKLISDTLILEGHSQVVAGLSSLLWLYNPLVIGVSTRGNAESLMAVLVLTMIYLLKCQLPVLCGIMLGAAIHFKIYPIIYILPIYLSFTPKFDSNVLHKKIMPNRKKIKFLVGLVLSFSWLTGMAYTMYGYTYFEEAFFYHIRRQDTRHNFSIYFYMLYLCEGRDVPAIGIATFLPQALLVAAFGFKYSTTRDVNFALFTQTVVFVTFNKVITSQYFIWFLMLLPLITPRLEMSKVKMGFLSVLWVGAQASWLLPAYLLEFQSVNAFVPIWLESIAFFCCNVGILISIIGAYADSPMVQHTIRKNR